MAEQIPFRDSPDRAGSPELFACWWSMVNAHWECADLPPIHPDDLIFHFSGSGASCMVFAKDITAVCELIKKQTKEKQNG